MKFEKIIRFRPAYDKRHKDPKKNCGIHGVDLLFVLKGKEGAVQFLLFTNWHLPHVQKELDSKPLGKFPYIHHKADPADLGYHSRKPIYQDQKPITESCEWLDGECYYDGSSLASERIYEILLEKGDEGVWKALRQYYADVFGSREASS